MLLLELRERLQRHGVYGYWIDPKNVPHEVMFEGHYDWIVENNLVPKLTKQQMEEQDLYRAAFARGYVRVEHAIPKEVGVEGRLSDINRAMPVLRPTLMQPELEYVIFDVTGSIKHSTAFNLPEQREGLRNHISRLSNATS